jgi:magnesium-transporting ATPase (P-type)
VAGLTAEPAELNTIITMLGCLCATVQAATGYYAGYKKKKIGLLKTNDILFRSHRAFGSFATTLFFLGLFAGVTGYISTILTGVPPFEVSDFSFNFHFWLTFPVFAIVLLKTYFSYFNKRLLYKKFKWLGIATFIAWAQNWISSGISYYLRTLPSNPQHSPPIYLLPVGLMGLQIILPFIIGAILGFFIVRVADKKEKQKLTKS